MCNLKKFIIVFPQLKNKIKNKYRKFLHSVIQTLAVWQYKHNKHIIVTVNRGRKGGITRTLITATFSPATN